MITREYQKGKFTVVEIEDEFSVITDLNDFKNMLEEKLHDDIPNIALRFKDISYIYSGPLGILARIIMNIKKLDGKIVLLEPNPNVSEILKMTNLDKMLAVVESEEALLNE